MKEKLLKAIKENLDMPGFMSSVMEDILEDALQKMVDDSSNPYDNMAKAALYPILEDAMKEKMAELWAKLMDEDEEPAQ